MGTDIHFFVEQREGDTWRHQEAPLVVVAAGPNEGMNVCMWCVGPGLVETDGETVRFTHLANSAAECPNGNGRRGIPQRVAWYCRRDHTVFDLLRRGGWGRIEFLDEERYADREPLVPIALTRGLPENVSTRVREEVERYDADAHSMSWLMLAEMLAFDWQEPIVHAAWAPSNKASEWQDWFDRVPGQALHTPAGLVSTACVCPPGHARITWQQPLWQHVHPTFFSTLMRMARLAGPRVEDVRCVFFFDN